MTRADPLLVALERAARALGLAERAVLVGVSGGIDSTVLAHGLDALAGRLGLRVALGHVNHGLRGADSDADQACVEALGAKLGVPVLCRRVAPKALRAGGSSRARPTLQEAARRLRYAALDEMAREAGASQLATAHTLDDQAETVLLRLLRGSGPSGLGGIPERSPDGRIVRPLLGLPRSEIERFAAARRLSWREDASNRDPAFARARLRRDWLRGLGEAFNPRWLRAIGDLAEAQRRESEWIEERVDEEAKRRLTREGEGKGPGAGDEQPGSVPRSEPQASEGEGKGPGAGDERPGRVPRSEPQASEGEGKGPGAGDEQPGSVPRSEPQASEGEVWVLDCAGFEALPPALARRLLRRVLHAAGAGRDLSRRHLERSVTFLAHGRTGATLELPGGLALERAKRSVRLVRRSTGRAQHGC